MINMDSGFNFNIRRWQALSCAGAVIRTGLCNDTPVKIGGVGGVMTHPHARRLGLASRAIERQIDFFKEQ